MDGTDPQVASHSGRRRPPPACDLVRGDSAAVQGGSVGAGRGKWAWAVILYVHRSSHSHWAVALELTALVSVSCLSGPVVGTASYASHVKRFEISLERQTFPKMVLVELERDAASAYPGLKLFKKDGGAMYAGLREFLGAWVVVSYTLLRSLSCNFNTYPALTHAPTVISCATPRPGPTKVSRTAPASISSPPPCCSTCPLSRHGRRCSTCSRPRDVCARSMIRGRSRNSRRTIAC